VHNKYFIVSIDVVGEDVRVLYKHKSEKSNRELRGNISEFDFKIRDVLLYKHKPFFIINIGRAVFLPKSAKII
jgi:hypothetical protein